MKFRLKISLLSLCISGIVLIAFGIFFILVFHRVGIDRLDREIRTLGDANLVKSREHPPWERFGDSLKFVYGEQEIERLAVFVFDTSDITLFKSDGFPEALAAVPIPPSPVGDEADERVDESQDDWRPPRRGPGRRPPPRGHHPPFGGPDVDAEWEGPPDHPDPDRRREPRGMRRPLLREPLFSTLEADGKRWRVGAMGDRRVIMIVGVDLSAFDAEVGRFRTALFVATPISLMLLALGGWLLAGRALRPIIAITETAEGITATDLDQRVPAVASDAELVRLVDVINGMLDRLERSFSQAMRFSADAAHELQTPLTILQGELDHAVQQAQPESEEQQRYSNLLEEVQGLKAIIQKLLVLARADAGELTLNREPVDLSELVASAAEDAGVIGPELRIEQSIAPGVTVMGDVDLLHQVLRNLTSNAVKYNCVGGHVRFDLMTDGSFAYVVVSNTGDPIPVGDRDRIFERFYRVEKSRSRRVGGAGLGLSLAREIARSHQGDLTLEAGEQEVVSFSLKLPLR